MKIRDFALLLSCIIISELAGLFGSLFNFGSISGWYPTLVKPALNPPNWIFGPVWSTLFLLIGISLYLIISHRRKFLRENKYFKPALIAFGAQWILNIAWSFIFFYLRRPDWAGVEIILLIASIIALMFYSFIVFRPAAFLLMPYLAWVSFATYLNMMIWWLN